jgi:tetratricopeptide (TPR) repeat protein
MGKPLIAMQHFESAISLYDPERHPLVTTYSGDARLIPLSYAAITLWALGYPDQALKRSNEALGLAHALSNPHDLAFAEFFVGRLLQVRRDAHAAQEATERLIALSIEHGFTFWLATATIEHGAAIAEQGRNEEGIEQMEEGFLAFVQPCRAHNIFASSPRRALRCGASTTRKML